MSMSKDYEITRIKRIEEGEGVILQSGHATRKEKIRLDKGDRDFLRVGVCYRT